MDNLNADIVNAQIKVEQLGRKLSLAQEHKSEIQHFYGVDISPSY